MDSRRTADGRHITVSYAGFNRPWAVWIAHQLNTRGHEATTRRWDPRMDVPFEEEFGALLATHGRVLLVLDNWYFGLGPVAEADWDRVLRRTVSAHPDRFAAVTVATQRVPGAVSLLKPADLHDLDEHEAARRLLRRLSIDPALPVQPSAGTAPRFPNEPPEVLDTPRRNRRFTGRDLELELIHAALTLEETGHETVTRIVLHGISGTGKTQIAAEYAHRFGNDYDVVWWIDATHRAKARERLAALAPRLGLPVGERIGERIRAVHEAARSAAHGRWLLVFDGAEDPAQLADLLPDQHTHVLLTAGSRDWSGVPGTRVMAIHPFTRTESVAYVRRRAPRLTAEEADGLASTVRDLPLLLAQTAAWLDANDVPAQDYLRLLRAAPEDATDADGAEGDEDAEETEGTQGTADTGGDEGGEGTGDTGGPGGPGDPERTGATARTGVTRVADEEDAGEVPESGEGYPLGFRTAWSTTLDTLRERNPEAAELLNLLAFFAPAEIPVRLLTEVRHGDLPPPWTNWSATPAPGTWRCAGCPSTRPYDWTTSRTWPRTPPWSRSGCTGSTSGSCARRSHRRSGRDTP